MKRPDLIPGGMRQYGKKPHQHMMPDGTMMPDSQMMPMNPPAKKGRKKGGKK